MTGVPLHKLSAGSEVPETVNAVIEVPRGSRARFEFDAALQAFRLASLLAKGGGYPADYGFVPSTVSQDGHPLDIFVLSEEPAFPGCVVPCRPVGVLHLSDGTRPDHKILAVALADDRYRDARDLGDLPEEVTEALTAFFVANPLLSGQEETVEGWEGADAARDVIFRAWEGFLL